MSHCFAILTQENQSQWQRNALEPKPTQTNRNELPVWWWKNKEIWLSKQISLQWLRVVRLESLGNLLQLYPTHCSHLQKQKLGSQQGIRSPIFLSIVSCNTDVRPSFSRTTQQHSWTCFLENHYLKIFCLAGAQRRILRTM